MPDGNKTVNGHRISEGMLMKNIMRLVVAGSVGAITVNILMLLG